MNKFSFLLSMKVEIKEEGNFTSFMTLLFFLVLTGLVCINMSTVTWNGIPNVLAKIGDLVLVLIGYRKSSF